MAMNSFKFFELKRKFRFLYGYDGFLDLYNTVMEMKKDEIAMQKTNLQPIEKA